MVTLSSNYYRSVGGDWKDWKVVMILKYREREKEAIFLREQCPKVRKPLAYMLCYMMF